MKSKPYILTLALCAVLFLAGCGAGSTSSGLTQPSSSPTVSSVTVSPATVNVTVSSTQQFKANVSGTNGFSTAVTWSATGMGSVDANGLFTADTNTGPAFVTATSVETPSVSGSGQITVTAAPVFMPGWYGTLVPSDGSAPLPMDFDLTQTGNALTSGPVLVIAATNADISFCTNLDLYLTQGYGNITTISPALLNNKINGSVNGQNITLSFSPFSTTVPVPISLTGTLGQDASGYATITGTFTKPAGGCFAPISGTFTFNQYQSFSGSYLGSFTYGVVGVGTPPVTANNVQLTLTLNSLSYSAIPPPFNYPASPVFTMFSETAGRFFHVWTSYAGAEVGSTNLVVWGVVAGPDQQGNQLNGYVGTTNVGLAQLFDPTFPLSGTLTH